MVNDNNINVKEEATFNNPSTIKAETRKAKVKIQKVELNTKKIKTNKIGKFGKIVQNYGGLNYTLELKEGEGSPQLERWRRRLRELLGESQGGAKEEEEEVGRMERTRRESVEPIYSSEHRIAWLCGDPSMHVMRMPMMVMMMMMI